MMILDEAVNHLTDLLVQDDFPCKECRNEHDQLRDWLVELMKYREMDGR